MSTTQTKDPVPSDSETEMTQVLAALDEVNQKLEKVTGCVDDLSRRLESFDDLKEDLVPMAHSGMQMLYRQMHDLEQNGTLAFVKEAAGVAQTIATSFTPDDVQLLGDNVVSILNTVRNLTQPRMLGVADRAATALQSEPDVRVGLIKTMRDPEVRRGMALLFSVLRELGTVGVTAVPENGTEAPDTPAVESDTVE